MERRLGCLVCLCAVLQLPPAVCPAETEQQPRGGSIRIPADAPIEAPQPRLRLADGTEPGLGPLLTRWVRASEGIRSLEARIHRIVYDHVFKIETRSHGTYHVVWDGWRLKLGPADVAEGLAGTTKDQHGESYTIRTSPPETMVRAPGAFWWVHHAKRECGVYHEPDEKPVRPSGWFDWSGWLDFLLKPLPFATGATEADVHERYRFELVEEGAEEIRLRATPSSESERRQYSHMCVILDRHTLRTKAIQLFCPGGNETTVYVFLDATVNASADKSAESLVPDLAGYRCTHYGRR